MDEPGEIREVLVSADAHVLADGYFTGSKNICPSSHVAEGERKGPCWH